MVDVVVAVRSLVQSNLGWFQYTRVTQGEEAGRERAININKEVMDSWVPGLSSSATEVAIHSVYPAGDGASGEPPRRLSNDDRSLRLQGAGKNWRLAGDAIQGQYYDVREGDLLVMAFDRASTTLGWVVVRHGSDGRVIIPGESDAHARLMHLLGSPSGSMWLPSNNVAALVIGVAASFAPVAAHALMGGVQMLEAWVGDVASSGVRVVDSAESRLLSSLLAKRFVVLTGLTGSGKTLLALSLARWFAESGSQVEVVAVGSDWTSSDRILGYADALDPGRYESTQVLDLVLRAEGDPGRPYFLILDEMNLSHVERYFADFLSAMESGAPLVLHSDDDRGGIPARVDLPANLFVLGTVNIDETTYMFSPKVLDRANVIEFRASGEALTEYMSEFAREPVRLDGLGAGWGPVLLAVAADDSYVHTRERVRRIVQEELRLFFDVLAWHDSEFGFRTAKEIGAYVGARFMSAGPGQNEDQVVRRALDEQVYQKLLPRMNGSRRELEPVLRSLRVLCGVDHDWSEEGGIVNADQLAQLAGPDSDSPEQDEPFYPLSYRKASRMLRRLQDHGFASFAEA